jgi:hypothetical protein
MYPLASHRLPRFSLAVVAAAFVITVSSAANAGVTLFNNFGPDENHAFNNQSGVLVGTSAGLPPVSNAQRAVRIDVTGNDYFLDTIDAGLMWGTSTPNLGATFTVFADDGSNGLPGTSLGFASVAQTPTPPNSGADPLPFSTFDFSSQSLLLENGHSYWLVLTANTNENLVMWGLNLTADTNSGNEYLFWDGGGPWQHAQAGAVMPSLRVNGTVVPAPGALALIVLAGIVGPSSRRRRA